MDPVFPQKATHYQCLALTNKLSMPDANVMPPEVARPRRWLGDDKGWEKSLLDIMAFVVLCVNVNCNYGETNHID